MVITVSDFLSKDPDLVVQCAINMNGGRFEVIDVDWILSDKDLDGTESNDKEGLFEITDKDVFEGIWMQLQKKLQK